MGGFERSQVNSREEWIRKGKTYGREILVGSGGAQTRRIEDHEDKGEENPADIMTKPKSLEDIRRLTKSVGVQFLEKAFG